MIPGNKNMKGVWGTAFVALLITLGLRIPYLNFAALALSAYLLAAYDRESMLYFLMFLFPFAPIFKLSIGSVSFFTLLPPLAAMKLLWMDHFCLRKSYGVTFILFSIYAVLISVSTDLVDTISMLLSLLMAALFLQVGNTHYSFKKVVEYNCLGIVLTSIIAMCTPVFPRLAPLMNDARIKMGAGNYYYRFAGLMVNPNYYTMMVSVALAALCILIIQRRMSVLDYGLFAALSVFGLMSVSKSFIVTYAAMLLLLAVFFLKEKPQYVVYGLVGCSILGFIIYKFLGEAVITTILFRFSGTTNVDLASVTTGRSVFWLEYLNFWLENIDKFLFGSGLGAANLYGHASHNFYLEIVYYLGIVGGSLYVLCLGRIFRPGMRAASKAELYCYLPWIIFLIRGMARNIILSEQLVFFLMICTLSLTDNMRNTELRNGNAGFYPQQDVGRF